MDDEVDVAAQQRLAQGGGEHPGRAEPFDRRGRLISRRGHRDQDGRPAAPLTQLPGDLAGLGQRERAAAGAQPQRTVVRGAHVLASPVLRSKSCRSASR